MLMSRPHEVKTKVDFCHLKITQISNANVFVFVGLLLNFNDMGVYIHSITNSS